MTTPKLTIGTTHFDDFTGLWATIQSLRIYHADVIGDCELLIVDNNPESAHGKAAKDLAEGWSAARWVAAPEAIGTAPAKDRVFREAQGDAVLYLDCHVLVEPRAIARLIRYYAEHPHTKDLLSGPMVYDDLTGIATHFADVWRGEMWGIWDVDERGTKRNAAPFEIPAMGMGLCSCRREAWVGFNERFRGFGGEEFYIHEKFRQAGARCLCLPFLRWVHRFGRPNGVPFPVQRWDKVRNYVIGHLELGMPLDRVKEHFVDLCKMPIEEWEHVIADAKGEEWTPKAKPRKRCCGDPRPAGNGTTSIEALFETAKKTRSDINEHCEKLRELAGQCKHVTEFGMRPRISTVALASGKPERMVTYAAAPDSVIPILRRELGAEAFEFRRGTSLTVDIDETDLLFLDTRHTDEHLTAELTKHADRVRRWIVLHDTAIYGKKGEDGGAGLLSALRRFMRDRPEWSVFYHTLDNNGLTVISRDKRDKPVLPSKIQMAKSLAAAVANHIADGGKMVEPQQLRDRLERCTLCGHRTETRCAVCGCFVTKKATWRSAECPLGKWET